MVDFIEELNESHNGKYISCVIRNTFIKKALIYYCKHNKAFYILQNIICGAVPYDYRYILGKGKKKEFECSWGIGKGSSFMLKENGVSNILLLDNQLIHELW